MRQNNRQEVTPLACRQIAAGWIGTFGFAFALTGCGGSGGGAQNPIRVASYGAKVPKGTNYVIENALVEPYGDVQFYEPSQPVAVDDSTINEATQPQLAAGQTLLLSFFDPARKKFLFTESISLSNGVLSGTIAQVGGSVKYTYTVTRSSDGIHFPSTLTDTQTGQQYAYTASDPFVPQFVILKEALNDLLLQTPAFAYDSIPGSSEAVTLSSAFGDVSGGTL